MSNSNQKKTTAKKNTGTNSRRTTAAKKNTTSKNKGRSNNRKKSQEQDFASFHEEVIIWVLIGVAILLILGNMGLCGAVGNFLSSIFFGSFGIVQYVLPVVVLLLAGLLMANDFSTLAVKKTLLTILFLAMCSSIAQMITNFDEVSIFDAVEYSFYYHTGGGFLGGFFALGLRTYLGKPATVVIVVLTMLISLMLIFERSILKILKEAGLCTVEASKKQKEAYLVRKEEAAVRRKERGETAARSTFRDTLLSGDKEENVTKKPKRRMVDIGERFGIDTSFDPSGKQKEKNVPVSDDSSVEPERKPEVKSKTPSWFDNFPEEESAVAAEKPKDLGVQELLFDEITKENVSLSMESPKVEDGSSHFSTEYPKTEEEDSYSSKESQKSEASFEAKEELDRNLTLEGETETIAGIRETKREEESSVSVEKKAPKAAKPAIDLAVSEQVKDDLEKAAEAVEKPYVFPPYHLMSRGENGNSMKQQKLLRETAMKLQQTLENFGVRVTITDVSCGPSITRYELQPEQGVKVSKIVGLADDIKLNLAAADIRIEAPIPGKAAIGIEVPNKHSETVKLRDLLEDDRFKKASSRLSIAVGKDIAGNIIIGNIAKMPHVLIAGATGSGKSVFINTLITSILYKADPNDVKFIMIDPKVVELSTYNGIPHLLIPVVTDPQKAAGALNWAVMEMTDRYNKFAEYGVRNLEGYNKKVEEVLATGEVEPDKLKKLPQIVIIVDELADLMMVAPGEVESSIVRLSQLARAAGIHLVIATQRPSVNVITGLIKANVPSRIAFAVSSGVDSRTIIDMNGAEKLLGNGDMLYAPYGQQKPVRVQGAFISDKEVSDIVEFLKANNEGNAQGEIAKEVSSKIETTIRSASVNDDRDELFQQAAKFIVTKEKASIGMIQRMFKVGFNRASRIMEQLADAGIVGPEEGTKPRKILMSEEQLEVYLEEYV